MSKSPITTHVLDTATGLPAEGIHCVLSAFKDGEFVPMAEGHTNADGRITDMLEPGSLTTGTYKMFFAIADYNSKQGVEGFYPYAEIVFVVSDTAMHHHIPLLLSPFGYSTYRGS